MQSWKNEQNGKCITLVVPQGQSQSTFGIFTENVSEYTFPNSDIIQSISFQDNGFPQKTYNSKETILNFVQRVLLCA